MPSRFKTSFEKAFDGFLSERFTEHHRRIVKGRRNARWALFTYPIGLALLCALPVAVVAVVVAALYERNHPRVAEILTPESAAVVMPILYALCGGIALVGLLLGVSLGVGRAAQMIFESEQQELTVRQTYYLRALFRAEKRKAARRAKRAASGRVAAYGRPAGESGVGYEGARATAPHVSQGHPHPQSPVAQAPQSQGLPDLGIRPRG